MDVVWSARAIRDMAKLAKFDRKAIQTLKAEAVKFADDPSRFLQRGNTNFKFLSGSEHQARLRSGELRALMDRQQDTWVVARVVRRSESTYG